MVLDRIALGLSGPPKFSGLVLALANMVPVAGVILWNWSVFEIVALYWAENVIIGLLNVPRMLLAKGTGGSGDGFSKGLKFLMIPFFFVHYGFFCSVHGFFVFSLLGKQDYWEAPFAVIPKMLGQVAGATGGAFALLVLSHAFSFFWNYVGQREYRERQVSLLMFAPYGRIVILHIAILFGAFAIEMLGSPMILLLILIAGKTAMDLGFHLFSHSQGDEGGE